MPEQREKPWDARLVEWMSRDSSPNARNRRIVWSNKARTGYAAGWVVFELVSAQYLYAGIAGLGVVVCGVLWLREARRGR
jgi:hypothetical protein